MSNCKKVRDVDFTVVSWERAEMYKVLGGWLASGWVVQNTILSTARLGLRPEAWITKLTS